MCFFVTDFSHSACFQGSSMPWHVLQFYPFLWLSNIPLYGQTTLCLCIHDGHLSIMNNAAMNVSVRIFVWTYVFHSLGCTPRGGIAGPYDKSRSNFLRRHHAVFHSGCPISHSCQRCGLSSSFSTFSSILVIVRLDSSRPRGSEVASRGFDFCSPDGK